MWAWMRSPRARRTLTPTPPSAIDAHVGTARGPTLGSLVNPMPNTSHDISRTSSPEALTAFFLASALALATGTARADPPAAPPPSAAPAPAAAPVAPPDPGSLVVGAPQVPGAPDVAGPPTDKPSLLKELPIAAYCVTAAAAAGGGALYAFGQGAVDQLKIPADHTTPSATHSLVVRARVGQVFSAVLFPITGLAAVWGTVSTVRAVMKVSKAVKAAPIGVSVGPVQGGLALGVDGRF